MGAVCGLAPAAPMLLLLVLLEHVSMGGRVSVPPAGWVPHAGAPAVAHARAARVGEQEGASVAGMGKRKAAAPVSEQVAGVGPGGHPVMDAIVKAVGAGWRPVAPSTDVGAGAPAAGHDAHTPAARAVEQQGAPAVGQAAAAAPHTPSARVGEQEGAPAVAQPVAPPPHTPHDTHARAGDSMATGYLPMPKPLRPARTAAQEAGVVAARAALLDAQRALIRGDRAAALDRAVACLAGVLGGL